MRADLGFTMVTPSTAGLFAAACAVLLTIAAMTAVPAWIHTRLPAGTVLKTDSV
jgi:putative ABC transport system permease protein